MSNVPDELQELWSDYVEAVKDVAEFESENTRFLAMFNRLKDRKKEVKEAVIEQVANMHREGKIDGRLFDDMVGVYFGFDLVVTNNEGFIEAVKDCVDTNTFPITMGEAFRVNLTKVKSLFIEAVRDKRIPSNVEDSPDGVVYVGDGFIVAESRKVRITRELK